MLHPAATIQISPESAPSTPAWFGEVAAVAQALIYLGRLEAMKERVRFARPRFGLYNTIDFVVVLIGYALSGEPRLFRAFGDEISSRERLENCPFLERSSFKNRPLLNASNGWVRSCDRMEKWRG